MKSQQKKVSLSKRKHKSIFQNPDPFRVENKNNREPLLKYDLKLERLEIIFNDLYYLCTESIRT